MTTSPSKLITLTLVGVGAAMLTLGALAPAAPAVKRTAGSTSAPVPAATEHPAPVEQPTPTATEAPTPGPAPDPYDGPPPVGSGLSAPVVAPTVAPTVMPVPPPRPAATVNPCPVQTWRYRVWTATHPTPTYMTTGASPVRSGVTYPTGTHLEGCQRPDGWVANFSGWISGADL